MKRVVSNLDHLVVAADTLEQGVEYIQNTLCVTVPYGGVHPQMGTHNHVAKIGKNTFIEIIAINPKSIQLTRPRWFNLDDPNLQRRLKKRPRLISWVVNTTDIYECINSASCSFGTPEPIRRGDLSWHFGLPSDGRLLAGGMLPYLIQWHTSSHPSLQMAEVGLELTSLKIYHPYSSWLQKTLRSVNAHDLVDIKQQSSDKGPCIEAAFNTPSGHRTLRSE